MNKSKEKEIKQIEKLVLDLINSENYRPIKPTAIVKKLNLDDHQAKLLKRTLKYMIKKGSIIWGPKHLVMKAERKAKSNEVVGVFRRATAGYGFVTPEGSTVTDRSEDVFIPKHKAGDASDRDTVRIKVSRRRQGSDVRMSGRVIEVLDRSTHRFVGTYSENGNFGIVVVDNGVFESGILVGDAGAKNCRVGDKVVIEMANFPSQSQDGEGVIVEVLGDRGSRESIR